MTMFRTLIAIGLQMVFLSAAFAQTADNVLIVTNSLSQASGEIAEYYARARAISGDQILRLPMPVQEELDRPDYVSKIERPIAEWLTRNAAQDRILYIVLTKDIPLRIRGSAGPGGTVASVDSELTLLYRKMYGGPVQTAGATLNPMFVGENPIESVKAFTHRTYDIYLVGRLDGYTVADVKALIDRGVSPSKQGQVVLDGKLELRDSVGNKWLRAAAASLQKRSAWANRVVIDTGQTTLTGQTDVIGFYTWGSNAVMATERRFGHQFVPGAIAAEYVSTDARTFKEPPPEWRVNDARKPFGGSAQSLIGDFIRDGISGVAGHVAEPYLNGTIRPDALFPAYVAGFNVIESFYLAMPSISWQTVVVGDPLCAPFAPGPPRTADVKPAVETTTELPAFFSARRLAVLTASGIKPEAAEWFARSEVRRAKGDMAGVREALEQTTKRDDSYAAAQVALGMLYESEKEWDRAIAQYHVVVEKHPTHAVALNNLAYLLAIQKNDPETALPLANRAYRASISDPLIADTLAWVYHLLGRDALAEPIITLAARQRANVADVRLHAAIIFGALNKRDLAVQHLDAAVRLAPALANDPAVTELRGKLTPPK